MKHILSFLALILLTACSTAYLSLPLQSHKTQNFKINGVYYKKYYDNGERFSAVCFYQNGAYLMNIGSRDSSEFIDKLKNGFYDSLTFIPKYFWGRFVISGNKIIINRFAPGSPVALFSVIEKGEILNDSAFVITHIQVSDEEKPEQVRQIYRYLDLPKPKVDSNNAYVLGLK